jgi:hypothetical protein
VNDSIGITVILSSVIFAIFMSSMMTNAYADYYESGFRLIHNPTIYAMTPPPDPTIPNLDSQLFEQTQSAVLDWETHLNQGEGTHPLWNINLVSISFSPTNSNSSIPSPADIQIFYLPSPTSTPSAEEPVGLTTYDFVNHKAQIIIYYDKITTRIITTETSYSNYILYQYTPVSSYSDQLASDAQLGMAIEHELGHALGMGHYKISEDEENNIISGKQTDIPSIMIPVVIPVGVSGLGITQSDINQLKSLYDDNGFNSPIQPSSNQIPIPQIPSPTSTPVTQTVVSTSTTTSIPSWVKNNANYWSNGDIDDNDFIKGIQYMIQQKIISIPPTTQGNSSQNTIPSWVKSDAKFWAQGEITDNDFIQAIQFLVQQGIINVQ